MSKSRDAYASDNPDVWPLGQVDTEPSLRRAAPNAA
jgi:hypothetical protein